MMKKASNQELSEASEWSVPRRNTITSTYTGIKKGRVKNRTTAWGAAK